MHEVNIATMEPGMDLGGGPKGKVIECPWCKRAGCKVKTKWRRGEAYPLVAHRLTVTADKASWTSICKPPRMKPGPVPGTPISDELYMRRYGRPRPEKAS